MLVEVVVGRRGREGRGRVVFDSNVVEVPQIMRIEMGIVQYWM